MYVHLRVSAWTWEWNWNCTWVRSVKRKLRREWSRRTKGRRMRRCSGSTETRTRKADGWAMSSTSSWVHSTGGTFLTTRDTNSCTFHKATCLCSTITNTWTSSYPNNNVLTTSSTSVLSSTQTSPHLSTTPTTLTPSPIYSLSIPLCKSGHYLTLFLIFLIALSCNSTMLRNSI